jgi:2-keto-4-pentenoate hydratase/2-oxohepta-3-ene-1,7-dioic acid hydratase in catechol pathway
LNHCQDDDALILAAADAHLVSLRKGYTLALDLTARNLQATAKKAGNPWSVAKV